MEIPFVYKWYSVQRKYDGDPTSHQGINGWLQLFTHNTLSQKRFVYACVEENIELLKESKISDIEDDAFYVDD